MQSYTVYTAEHLYTECTVEHWAEQSLKVSDGPSNFHFFMLWLVKYTILFLNDEQAEDDTPGEFEECSRVSE